jgi:large subunit ribosomal protein L4
MRLPVVGGAAAAELEVAEATFATTFNEPLVHQVVVSYLAASRAGTKAQKSRALVSGGGRKPWKQKGSGRARAGSTRSPLWRGGGKIFAARPRAFNPKINRKMYRGAMRSILAELVRRKRLLVLDPGAVALSAPKTRELVARIRDWGVDEGSLLLVVEAHDERLALAARNLPDVDVSTVEALDPVRLVRFVSVAITAPALKKIEEMLA